MAISLEVKRNKYIYLPFPLKIIRMVCIMILKSSASEIFSIYSKSYLLLSIIVIMLHHIYNRFYRAKLFVFYIYFLFLHYFSYFIFKYTFYAPRTTIRHKNTILSFVPWYIFIYKKNELGKWQNVHTYNIPKLKIHVA